MNFWILIETEHSNSYSLSLLSTWVKSRPLLRTRETPFGVPGVSPHCQNVLTVDTALWKCQRGLFLRLSSAEYEELQFSCPSQKRTDNMATQVRRRHGTFGKSERSEASVKPGAVPATFAGSPKQNNSVLWASSTTFRFCQNRYSLVGHSAAQQTIISSILDRQSHAAVLSLTDLSLEQL